MFPIPLLRSLAFCALAALANAGPLTNPGRHPTSQLTAYPAIHSLKQFGGRIYLTYGDWNEYPAVTITSYELESNSFRIEFSANTDSIGYLREWNGRLYAPANDPIHYEDFHEYSVLDPALGWRDRAPWGCFHVFDFAALGNTVYAAAAKDAAEGTGTGAVLWRSMDGERTWTPLRSNAGIGRYYWCFPHLGRVYVQDGYWNGTTFVVNNALSSYPNLYKPSPVQMDGTESIVALANRVAGLGGTASALLGFQNGTLRTLTSSAYDFTWADGALWALTDTRQVMRATTLSPTPNWQTLPITGMPGSATAIEVYNGVLYIGDGSGYLHAARLDEQPLVLPPLAIISALPDAFGRALALQNGRLAVGAPDFSGTVPVAGQLQLFQQPIAPNGWTPLATLSPPAPKFSGWFAKDVALLDDVMAIVEAGYDLTGRDRGSAARVHVYQNRAGLWQSAAILAVPFAHSAALMSEMLVVGTSNPAANQVAGRPGVNPFRITRDGNGAITLTAQTQLAPTSNNWGYKSTARVALAGNLLIAGFSGDVSRDGAPGMISIFTRNAAGTGFNAAAAQEFVTTLPIRLGFALSYDGTALAVGAPRDDTVARQAGAVRIYRRNGNALVLEKTIASPVVEAEANFGHSVAIDGDVLLVGCPGATVDDIPQRGAVFLFKYIGATWSLAGQLHAPPAAQGEFGIEVAIDPQWMAAGSRFSDNASTLTERVALASRAPAFSAWTTSHQLSGNVALPNADPDRDGLSNLGEYLALLDPRTPDTRTYAGADTWRGMPRVVLDPAANGRLLVTFVRRTDDPRLGSYLEVSSDLQSWQRAVPTLIASSVQGGAELRTVAMQAPAGIERFFVRLRADYTF